MTDRDRLIELIKNSNCVSVWDYHKDDFKKPDPIETLADNILADGWIRPPCKVGQVVWVVSHWYKYTKPEIESRKILSVQIYKNGNIQYHYKDGCFWREHIGKTVFLTKEEAEQKLKELNKGE